MGEPIYIVICDGPMILAAYRRPQPAHTHMRCITGASVVLVEVLDEVPATILDDLVSEDFDEDQDTPVTEVPIDEIEG